MNAIDDEGPLTIYQAYLTAVGRTYTLDIRRSIGAKSAPQFKLNGVSCVPTNEVPQVTTRGVPSSGSMISVNCDSLDGSGPDHVVLLDNDGTDDRRSIVIENAKGILSGSPVVFHGTEGDAGHNTAYIPMIGSTFGWDTSADKKATYMLDSRPCR